MTADQDDNYKDGPPRVFISYTHETPEHSRWVNQLWRDLRKNGVGALLDQEDVSLGDDLTLFMERGIRMADRVILVCTPTYRRKANDGEGGVGYERMVVTGELASEIGSSKFICALRVGTKEDAIPTFAQTRLFLDFTDDSTYDDRLEELLRDIHGAPKRPKPPVGANPFKGEDCEAVSSGAGSRPVKTSATTDPQELNAQATNLLRQKDLVGWKQLVRSVRKDVPKQLLAWRESAEKAIRSGRLEDNKWFSIMHAGCRTAAPLIVLSLSALEAEIPDIPNQRGLVDDLMDLPGWERSGPTTVIEAPGAIAYVYHHILGSFLIRSGRQPEAIRLLRAKVPIGVTAGSEYVEEVWNCSELMGFAESLGHRLSQSWQFLESIWEHHQWLHHFFVDSGEFELGIRGYTALAAILELACAVSRNPGVSDTVEWSGGGVPAVFLSPMKNTFQRLPFARVVEMAVPNRETLELIATQFDSSANQIRSVWRAACLRWRNNYSELFHDPLMRMVDTQSTPPLP